jgi:hypothetical protein
MARSDFNGDGRSDVLSYSDGRLVVWLATADGFIVDSGFAAQPVGTNWAAGAIGDFNGDGRDDILWLNFDRFAYNTLVSTWLAKPDGTFSVGGQFELAAGEWVLIGTGDFNGDGRDDLVWNETESTGARTIWLASGEGDFVQGRTDPLVAPYYLFGVGDFNGDQRDDLLWRTPASGSVGNLLADPSGEFILNVASNPGGAGMTWQNSFIGDFNGDGRDDILWRHSSGALSSWLATSSGGFVVDPANVFTPVPSDWRLLGVGDYNGDGRDDILWHHDSGLVGEWLGQASGGFNVVNVFVQPIALGPWDY